MSDSNDAWDVLRARFVWGTSGCLGAVEIIGDDGTGGAWVCSLRSFEAAVLFREYLRMSKMGMMGMVAVEERNGSRVEDDEHRTTPVPRQCVTPHM